MNRKHGIPCPGGETELVCEIKTIGVNVVQDQHQLSEPQAPLTIIDLLFLLMFITAASRKSDFGENKTEGFLLQNTRSWQDSDSIW